MSTPLICVKELAVELGVSEKTVRRAVWSGAIPFFRICRTLRFDVDAVREAMRQRARFVNPRGLNALSSVSQ
jgi:excisionase family DNA binding protein